MNSDLLTENQQIEKNIMNASEKETGMITALIQGMEQQRLPQAFALKEKLDQGERLADYDITFLKEVFADVDRIKTLIDKHPEYHEVTGQEVSLYHDITSKALENEKAS